MHGDLTGNVLLAPGLELCWRDLPAEAVAASGMSVDAVARALLFRVLTTNQRIVEGDAVDDVDGE